MSTVLDPKAERLIAELYTVKGNAEIGDGIGPGTLIETSGARGVALGENVGFPSELPGHMSFCPDAAYYTGPHTRMNFPSQRPVSQLKSGARTIMGAALNVK
jgi:hypothetical protein